MRQEQRESAGQIRCRMHRALLPEVGDSVMVRINEIDDDVGLSVELLEYEEQYESIIPPNEITNARKRPAKLSKLVRLSSQVAAQVLRVDTERQYIDLSMKRLSDDEKDAVQDCFAKSKVVHTIVRVVSERLGVSMEALYEQLVWPLAEQHGETCYACFVKGVTDPSVLETSLPSTSSIDEVQVQLPATVKEVLLKQIKLRLSPRPSQWPRTS